jgi:vacuolar-type H+-ATPase subunit F/Vma7
MKTTKNYGHIRLSLVITVFMLFSVFATAWNVNADDKKPDDKKAKSKDSRFLIITSHTPEQCLKSLDEYATKTPDLLKKIDWGCKVGDHTGYVVVKATDETAARYLLPYEERKTVRIIQVDKFTVEQIKELHEKM